MEQAQAQVAINQAYLEATAVIERELHRDLNRLPADSGSVAMGLYLIHMDLKRLGDLVAGAISALER